MSDKCFQKSFSREAFYK